MKRHWIVAAVAVSLAGCLPNSKNKQKICREPENQPSPKLEIINLPLGGARTLAAGEIFSGVAAPNEIRSVSIVGEPGLLKASRQGCCGVELSAKRLDYNVRDAVQDFGQVEDSVSVQVETMCGSATASFAVRVTRPPQFVEGDPIGPLQLLPPPPERGIASMERDRPSAPEVVVEAEGHR
jgi:hypothetical protein